MAIEIRNHRIYVGGRAVAYRATPNKSGKIKPEGIIVHDTAGDLAGTGSIEWLCNPKAKASAHVVVDRDGTITQLAPLNVATWHAGKSEWKGRRFCNAFTIGIEIVNPGALVKYSGEFSNNAKEPHRGVKVPAGAAQYRNKDRGHGAAWWMDYTPAQIATVKALCAAIRDAYGVTFIAPHWEISPGRKVDTNPLFPLEDLRAATFGAGVPVTLFGGGDDVEDMSVGAIATPRDSMLKSSEGNIHIANGTIGAGMSGTEIADAKSLVDQAIEAKQQANALGINVSPMTLADYIMPAVSKLATSPLFWIGAAMVAWTVYGWLRRRRRMREGMARHRAMQGWEG